jgi:hypothetical protein
MDAFTEAHILGLKHSLDTMPASSYRDYLDGLLSQEPLNQEWVKLIALESLLGMTLKLFNGILEPEEIEAITPYIVMMNVYQVYEVVSDNLALGLTKADSEDERRHVLKAFNEIMVRRLLNMEVDYESHFRPYQDAFSRISTFEQSLSPHKHQRFAAEYSIHNPCADMQAIEYSLYPQLLVNIEGARALVDSLAGSRSQELIRTSLIRRYRDSGVWLYGESFDFDELCYFGTGSILVVPTLAYYIAVIGEILRKTPHFNHILEDNSLASALEMTALLVRLLNDIGSHLLISDNDTRKAVLRELAQKHQETGLDFADLVLDLFVKSPHIYTRLRKDIHFGEYNLLLALLPKEDAIHSFGKHLQSFVQRYDETYAQLQIVLQHINQRLGDGFVSIMILRFIRFHELLYSNASNTPEGEYAI